MQGSKISFLIIIVIILLSPLVFAQPPSPLKDVKISVTVTNDNLTGIYSYNYTIFNSPLNDGQIRHFEVDITRNVQSVVLSKEGLMKGPCYLKHTSELNFQRVQIVPVGIDGPSGYIAPGSKVTIWSCGLSVKGTASWGSTDEPFRIFPGQTLGGFILSSYGLPGIREATIQPAIDYDNLPPEYYENAELTKELQDSLTYHTKTLGPTAPPADFKPIEYLDYIINLKHEAFKLDWITNKGVENSLDTKLENARKKLEQGDIIAARNILNAFLNELEAQGCRTYDDCPSGKHLTPEAYALLYYNTKYLIDNLKQTE